MGAVEGAGVGFVGGEAGRSAPAADFRLPEVGGVELRVPAVRSHAAYLTGFALFVQDGGVLKGRHFRFPFAHLS